MKSKISAVILLFVFSLNTVFDTYADDKNREAGLSVIQLAPYQSEYKGKYNGFSITTHQKLEKQINNGQWLLSNIADSFLGSIKETSLFNVKDNKLLVTRYNSIRSVLGQKKSLSIDYDYAQGVATISGKEDVQIPLIKNYLDKLSYQLLLQQGLIQGKKEFFFELIDKNKTKVYHFVVDGEELVKIGNAQLKTIRVSRIRKNNKRKTMLWFAPSLGFTMVKLQQNEDNREYSLKLTSHTASANNSLSAGADK